MLETRQYVSEGGPPRWKVTATRGEEGTSLDVQVYDDNQRDPDTRLRGDQAAAFVLAVGKAWAWAVALDG